MPAEHRIYARAVEYRHKESRNLSLAVPATALWWDVDYGNLHGSLLELVALHYAFEPLSLLFAVYVVAYKVVILDVAVGLVLSSVKNDKYCRTVAEGVVRCACC